MNLKQAFQKITASISISGSSRNRPQHPQPVPATQRPIVNPIINPSRNPVGYFMLTSDWF